jgi:hypothetical protein
MTGRRRSELNVGAGMAIGAGVGTALFVALDSPVWIGVGVAIGAALGSISSKKDDSESRGRD